MADIDSESPPTTDRRNFIRCSACGLVGLAALSIPACGGEATPPSDPVKETPRDTVKVIPTDTTKTSPKGVKFEINGNQIRVYVTNVPELVTVPSVFLIEPALTLVVRTGAQIFTALTAVCTHEGCAVTNFQDQHLVCPCHGSTFDLNGSVVVGPAVNPLAQFSSSYDPTSAQLLITKSN